ncbi:MAG: DNA primase [Planctomycetaceae bacterium]
MSTASPAEFKELVRSRTDIAELIGESVALQPQRGGRVFVGLCPFHPDHNPSLQVNPERQTYRCWVCDQGGDCFSFVMKHENLSFPEALELLARRAHLEIPKSSRRSGEGATDKTPLYDVLQWAERQFHECLLHSAVAQRARDYLAGRGFTPETQIKFQMGFHPEDPQWLIQRAQGKFRPEQLEAARLIAASSYGNGYYDEFRDRVVFPICDERGRCVAFGGRILPDSRLSQDAKYFNSKECPVFSKSRLVYGLNWARDAIKQAGRAVVVEGYADCVKLQQAGIGETLATLGTALTEIQVSLMKRFTSNIVLLFDGDDAGVRAAERAVAKFLAQDVDLRILTLPDELDPDEFIAEKGAAELRQLLDQAPEAWEYMCQRGLRNHGVATVQSRLRILDELLELLTLSPTLSGSVKENLFLSRLPQRLGIPEADIRKRLQEIRRGRRQSESRNPTAAGNSVASPRRQIALALQRSTRGDDRLECEIFQILFTDAHMMEVLGADIGPEDFQHELLRELWTICADLAEAGDWPTFDRVLTRIDCPDLKSLAVWLDEQARLRDVAGKLAKDGSGDMPSGLLNNALEGIKWRRARVSHEAAQLGWASQEAPAAGLTEETKLMLQQSLQFHQRRNHVVN